MADQPDDDDDFLEGEDEHGSVYDPEKRSTDDDLMIMALFGDVHWTDPDAVAEREAEIRALAGEES